jgi:hypothetical protein
MLDHSASSLLHIIRQFLIHSISNCFKLHSSLLKSSNWFILNSNMVYFDYWNMGNVGPLCAYPLCTSFL